MKLKSLYLDDERPTPLFTDKRVYTVEEAMTELATGTYTNVSLDHDLGTESTGYDLCCWIEAMAYSGRLPRLRWIVHSANPSGASRMRVALLQADKYWDINEFDPVI